MAAQSEELRKSAELHTLSSLKAAYNQIGALREQVSFYDHTLLPRSKVLLDEARAAYRADVRQWAALLEAWDTWIDTEEERTALCVQAHYLVSEVRHLTGEPPSGDEFVAPTLDLEFSKQQ